MKKKVGTVKFKSLSEIVNNLWIIALKIYYIIINIFYIILFIRFKIVSCFNTAIHN